MLENTLSTVFRNLITQQHDLTPYQTKQFDAFVKHLKKGDHIYPGQLKSKLNMDIKSVYQTLEGLRERGFLESNYEIYCPDCHRFKGEIVDSLTDIDPDASCDFCNHQFEPTKDTIMIYKVINDER
jgi:hypothetical protein